MFTIILSNCYKLLIYLMFTILRFILQFCRKNKKDAVMEKNEENLHILRHSASHIMAQAVQSLFPQAKLAIGPATDTGFYYDFDLTDGYSFTTEDLEKIENKIKEILKHTLTFEKINVKDVDAKIAEFNSQGEIYKAELLEEHR